MQSFLRRGSVIAGSVCLGVLTAMGSAKAACPSGPGFVAVPGSDTCLRLSGRVAAGATVGRHQPAGSGAGTGAEGRLSIDARTATEAGQVRAFVRLGAGQRRSGPFD